MRHVGDSEMVRRESISRRVEMNNGFCRELFSERPLCIETREVMQRGSGLFSYMWSRAKNGGRRTRVRESVGVVPGVWSQRESHARYERQENLMSVHW